MAYITPPADAVDFDLTAAPYVPSADFDLGVGARPEPSIVPGVMAAVGTVWRRAPGAKQAAVAAPFGSARIIQSLRQMSASMALVCDKRGFAFAYDLIGKKERVAALPWSPTWAKERAVTAPHKAAPQRDIRGKSAPWDDSIEPTDIVVAGRFIVDTPWKDITEHNRYFDVDRHGPLWRRRDNLPAPLYQANAVPGRADFDFLEAAWSTGPEAIEFASVTPERAVQPKDQSWLSPHATAPQRPIKSTIPWGPAGSRDTTLEFVYPDYDGPLDEAERPPAPTIKEVYIFMPTISLYRIPGGEEIEALDVTWACDSDSWAWRFNATLKREADLALLRPDSNGPREIACEINGHLWKGVVKSYAPTRSFGQTRITISGVSLSGWLSAPHALERSRVITSATTAQQIAADEVLNTGWTIDWQTQDWLIPADAFSYENLSPISAIKRLAEAVGAIVQSHQSDKTLIVKSRYPYSPHKWTDVATQLDAILPADLISQIGANYSSKPQYNRAISAGGATGGVIVTVTRDGTAGDILAPLVTDDLITDSDAGYERGRVEIARGGSWEQMQFSTWLLQHGDPPGLLLPGYLVEVQDISETYPVQISGTTVRAVVSGDQTTVKQTLQADRSITNV